LQAVADGGRLATITGDPPREERGVAVSDVYVRPDGRQLSALGDLLDRGTLSVPIASIRPLEQAAQALREVVAGAAAIGSDGVGSRRVRRKRSPGGDAMWMWLTDRADDG
jgi:NADPH:quinone reductase-like Zn-dependent oxidoreductase